MKIIFRVATVALTLTGCATHPIPDSDTRSVPTERVLAPQYLEAAPSTGIVTVKRDAGFMGSMNTAELLMDAQPVAELRRAERIVLHLPIGEHVLSAKVALSNLAEVSAIVKADSPLNFRIGISGAGDLSIVPTRF